MSKIQITNIVLRVGGKEINLSVEEAKELQRLLNETFGTGWYITYAPQPWKYWYVDYGSYTGNGTTTAYLTSTQPQE